MNEKKLSIICVILYLTNMCKNIQNMFQIMKKYTGKERIHFIITEKNGNMETLLRFLGRLHQYYLPGIKCN